MSVEVETRIILRVGGKEFNLTLQEARGIMTALGRELGRREERPEKPPSEWERASPTTWRKGTVVVTQRVIGAVSSAIKEWRIKKEIQEETGLSHTTVANALRFLRERGLAVERREGRARTYIMKELWRPNRGELPKIEAVANEPDLSALRREEERRRESMRET